MTKQMNMWPVELCILECEEQADRVGDDGWSTFMKSSAVYLQHYKAVLSILTALQETARPLSFAVECADTLNKSGGKNGKRVRVSGGILDSELRELNAALESAFLNVSGRRLS